jgi:hypothetical protein
VTSKMCHFNRTFRHKLHHGGGIDGGNPSSGTAGPDTPLDHRQHLHYHVHPYIGCFLFGITNMACFFYSSRRRPSRRGCLELSIFLPSQPTCTEQPARRRFGTDETRHGLPGRR